MVVETVERKPRRTRLPGAPRDRETNDEKLLVMIAPSLKAELFRHADALGVSASAIVRQAIRDAIALLPRGRDQSSASTLAAREAGGVDDPVVSGAADSHVPRVPGDPEPHQHIARDLGYMTICRRCGMRMK